MMKRLLVWLAAGVLGAGVVFAGGMAVAGGGSVDSALNACYHNHTGALRVDVSGTGCKSNETLVTLGAGISTRIVMASAVLEGFTGVAAECDHGEVVLGGGLEVASINPDIGIVTNGPITLGDGRQAWQVTMHFDGGSEIPVPFNAFAVCAPGTSS
jgi:hypothetical protein